MADEASDEDLAFQSQIRDAPEVPLPDGVTPVGSVRRITADRYASSGPDAPIGDDAGRAVTWVFLDAFFDDTTRPLFAPVFDVSPDGWETVIARSDGFETGRTTSAESLTPRQAFVPLAFEATCSPHFGQTGVPETCGDTERQAAAGDLEDVFDDLTGLGFTDQPSLTFRTEDVQVSVESLIPLEYEVQVDPAAWVMQLRPASQVSNAGMYASGSGSFWAAIGACNAPASRSRARRPFPRTRCPRWAATSSVHARSTTPCCARAGRDARGDQPRSRSIRHRTSGCSSVRAPAIPTFRTSCRSPRREWRPRISTRCWNATGPPSRPTTPSP